MAPTDLFLKSGLHQATQEQPQRLTFNPPEKENLFSKSAPDDSGDDANVPEEDDSQSSF